MLCAYRCMLHVCMYICPTTHTQIALVMVDEVHLLGESRGSCLEAGVIGRIKMISRFAALANVCVFVRMDSNVGG